MLSEYTFNVFFGVLLLLRIDYHNMFIAIIAQQVECVTGLKVPVTNPLSSPLGDARTMALAATISR